MSTYERLVELPLFVESHWLEVLSQEVSSGFQRVTTVVTLQGAGARGMGEDTTYEAEAHERELPTRAAWDLAGRHTVDSFSTLLEALLPAADVPHSRWAFESAALDLALRQKGVSLAAVLGRSFAPLRFVVSTRLGSPPTDEIVVGWSSLYPELEFKLDPQSSWSPDLFASLADLDKVRVLDLKGAYEGTPVDQPFDPVLYSRVRDAALAANGRLYIEDPARTPEAMGVLAGAEHLFSWDAVIHSVDDVLSLEHRPGALNIKPSRFGSLRRLLDCIDHGAEQEIVMYGGGQFELGPGRAQIQALASIFYPSSPNDVAPQGYNVGSPRPGLPRTPLMPASVPSPGLGFVC